MPALLRLQASMSLCGLSRVCQRNICENTDWEDHSKSNLPVGNMWKLKLQYFDAPLQKHAKTMIFLNTLLTFPIDICWRTPMLIMLHLPNLSRGPSGHRNSTCRFHQIRPKGYTVLGTPWNSTNETYKGISRWPFPNLNQDIKKHKYIMSLAARWRGKEARRIQRNSVAVQIPKFDTQGYQ